MERENRNYGLAGGTLKPPPPPPKIPEPSRTSSVGVLCPLCDGIGRLV